MKAPPTDAASVRFNEAADFCRRKPKDKEYLSTNDPTASMRPPTFAGGNPESAGVVLFAAQIASMRPPTFAGGNPGWRRCGGWRRRGFNEAADFCRRKHVSEHGPVDDMMV